MKVDEPDPQLDLFGASTPASRGATTSVIGPAPFDEDTTSLARHLPSNVRLGTSSWSFPGWTGLVYDRKAPVATVAREGLAAYAQHPLLRTVGVDRTYYAPIDASAFRAYAQAVPDDFQFVVKAHDWVTTARFPRHRRYGEHAGRASPVFLDPHYASEHVITPAREGLGPHLGVVLFQFPPQPTDAIGNSRRFAERIDAFLARLPSGPRYAFELRNHRLLTPRYLATLRGWGAVHCLSEHPTMHELHRQILAVDPTRDDAVVVRWMLAREHRDQDAKERFDPFDRLVEPDPRTRSAIVELIRQIAPLGRPVYVIVNNKAEGSAPLSIFELARALSKRSG